MLPVAERPRTTYTAVPLAGLASHAALGFPLYLRTGSQSWVLFRDVRGVLQHDHIGRLQQEGVRELYVRDGDRAAYYRRVEATIDDVLHDRGQPIERRAAVLHGIASSVAEDLLRERPDVERVQRAQRVMVATSGLLLRESQGFAAVRRVLGASTTLSGHSLTVGFLAMGLARFVLAEDPAVLMLAGLAGLLHDVGRVGFEQVEHDPEHAARGAALLQGLSLPQQVVDAAAGHHERHDGSGYPLGLVGEQIPAMARVVGMVDAFHKVYASQQPRVSVFDSLRILAQAYRGCFDERIAQGLVRLFR